MHGRFVACYRVSTGKQGRSDLGLEAQQETVRGFLNGGDWHLVDEVTKVESGWSSERPQLAKALTRLTRSVAFLSRLLEAGLVGARTRKARPRPRPKTPGQAPRLCSRTCASGSTRTATVPGATASGSWPRHWRSAGATHSTRSSGSPRWLDARQAEERAGWVQEGCGERHTRRFRAVRSFRASRPKTPVPEPPTQGVRPRRGCDPSVRRF
jgi:hypothetical protein